MNMTTSKIKNWHLATERDLLFTKYGFGMSEENWKWYTGAGEEYSKEQHLAFEVALATGMVFSPKEHQEEDFCIVGYSEKHGDIVITSHLAWARQRDGKVYIRTRTGSMYELEGMTRAKEYLRPEDTGKTAEELDALMRKYFRIESEEVIVE